MFKVNKVPSILSLFAFLIIIIQPVTAHSGDLGRIMHSMGSSYYKAKKAEDSQELIKHMTTMRESSVKAKDTLPRAVDKTDSERVKLYQAGLDQLIATIDSVMALAESNQMDAATAKLKDLGMIQKEYHTLFNVR